MTDALLIVPPLLKMTGTPLLGPAMLASAGRAAGHSVEVLELNAAWLAPYLAGCEWPQVFIGDHDRPSAQLTMAHAAFDALAGGEVRGRDHPQVLARAAALAESDFGPFVRARLPSVPPRIVGLSVMYEGQVIAALAISRIARCLFPSSLIVWGGAHVTALQQEIARDERYGAWVDRFVFGYAEATWVQLLDAVASGRALPPSEVRAEGDPRVTPAFDSLSGLRLALPVQASRGCAYGRCAFCTYPSIEGRYQPLELTSAKAVVAQAERIGAAISFKDSLVVPERLLELARMIHGRVRWSACTKLHQRFTQSFMSELAAGGCHTLEFGVETLDPTAQRLIKKSQSLELLHQLLDAAMASRIAVVLNYITGFPGIDAVNEERWLCELRQALADRPGLVAKLSLSSFELERLSPMARAPQHHGIRVRGSSPWSSLLEWAPASALLNCA